MTQFAGLGSVRRLELRPVVSTDLDPAYPDLMILIDGRDVLEEQRPGYRGFDPYDMLGPSRALLPDTPLRRVAVYRCSCRISGCNAIAPLIVRRRDGYVVWTDFRRYTGVYEDGPTTAEDPGGGDLLDFPDIVFDAEQYAAEVARASADRSWELPRRQTARLLEELLATQSAHLAAAGFELCGVSAGHHDETDVCEVVLWQPGPGRSGREQQQLELPIPPGPASASAQAMADTLLSSPASLWPELFPSRWQ